MEQNNNNNNTKNTTTTTEKPNIFKGNKTWDTTLKDLEEWQIARRNLDKWLDDAETRTFGSFFESKTNRTAPFSLQNLAIVAHTSSGYIGDLVRKAKTAGMEKALKEHAIFDEPSCYISLILDTLAPNLAEERAKREAERLAALAKEKEKAAAVWGTVDTILDMWQDLGITPDIAMIAKLCPKYKAKQYGAFIIATLAFSVNPNITKEETQDICSNVGIEPLTFWSHVVNRPAETVEE